jgi:uncharacterized membrane protein YhaH (DUF805 family)
MGLFKLALSPAGRVSPRLFARAVTAVYVAGVLSFLLLTASVTAVSGVLAFVLAQAVVIWAWLALHAKRLRDADRPIGLALAIAALYALSVVLLLLLIVLIMAGDAPADDAPRRTIDLFMVISSLGAIVQHPRIGATGSLIIGFLALSLMPAAIALFFSVWAGTRKCAPETP